jgi:hypothetical protein
MPRAVSINMPPNMGQGAVPWTPGAAAPAYDPSEPDSRPLINLYNFSEISTPVELRDLAWLLKSPKSPVAVDASTVPIDRLSALLDRWFPKKVD